MAWKKVALAALAGTAIIATGFATTYAYADRDGRGWGRHHGGQGMGWHGRGSHAGGGMGMGMGDWGDEDGDARGSHGGRRGEGRHGGRRGEGRHGGRHGGGFARLDANSDGKITFEEMNERRLPHFQRFDANSDSIVERSEVEAAIRARMEERMNRRTDRMFRRFDADRDGKVTLDEFNRLAKERFSWNDMNDDGEIAGDELPPRMRRYLERRGGQQEDGGEQPETEKLDDGESTTNQ